MEFDQSIIEKLSKEIGIKENQIKVVLSLLDEKATVPFIARYRKEMTGGLNEEEIRMIYKEWKRLCDLEKRKSDVIRLIDEKGMLNDEIKNKILAATKMIEVEDLYLPYKEKKKTKALEAIALGLEGLAKIIKSEPKEGDRLLLAKPFVKEGIDNEEDAIRKALYIIAEEISDNADFRKLIRKIANETGQIITKKKKNAVDEMEVYKPYYDFSSDLKSLKSYKVLAINRAEDEKVISVSLAVNEELILDNLEKKIIKNRNNIFYNDLKLAIADSLDRLILPSIEREIRNELTIQAEDQAIKVFSLNLKNLLIQSSIKGKMVLGVDPAFRTGCKLAVIDKFGKMLEVGVIYPNEKGKGQEVDPKLVEKSEADIVRLYQKYHFEIIAIGNGTASRETESFISSIISKYKLDTKYAIVSEAGASVYSASKVAIEEFPDLTLEKRSAVSIARRIQDPLAELVKIDPKSIGVGQYQHDVTESKLSEALDNVVLDAVNSVGVNLNTASKSLLSYVSGCNKTVAENIIKYRDEVKGFKSREELKNVAKVGGKTYEQAVGFLRVYDGKELLDQTSIHPESYKKAKDILKYIGLTTSDLGSKEMEEKVASLNKEEIKEKIDIDSYTLDDILKDFVKPIRDIRDDYQTPILKSNQTSLEDLKIGDELQGVVRNVVDFGAFVDCGVHYDGLVHISNMSTKFIKHPSEVVSVGDIVKVYVIDIDLNKHKLGLSLIKDKQNIYNK